MPTDASQLPTPIDWQTCEAASGGSGCRRIAFDWSPPPPTPLGTDADVAIDDNGTAVVLTSRSFQGGGRLHFVAAADGPVYSALLSTQLDTFASAAFLSPSMTARRWVLRILENVSANGGGYIGGTSASVQPTTHARFSSNAVHSAVVGDLGILDISANTVISLLDFDSGAKLTDIQTPSLSMSFEWMFRSNVFWQGNGGQVNDVGMWTPDGGAIDFINYGFDATHVAGDLGTDGTDMVWLEGHGSPTDAGPYTTMDYWTSPYAATSQQLQPRRLRSEATTAILGTPIAVGCGYAAYAVLGFVNGLRILRLSDGWSWYLPNVTGWYWTQALALTCSELFVSVQISGPIRTLARVALNQLGTGTAPD